MKKFFMFIGLLVIVISLFAPVDSFNSYGEEAKSDESKRLMDAVILYAGSPVAYFNNVETQIDSENSQVIPIIKNNRCLVPIRFISETLGGDVEWDGVSSTVTVNYGNKTIKMAIGKTNIYVNGTPMNLEVAAQIINERTYIPLRVMAESMGKKVFYDRGLIIISDKENIFDIVAEKTNIDNLIEKVNNLPTVGSYEKLKKLIKLDQYSMYSKQKGIPLVDDIRTFSNAALAAPSMSAENSSNMKSTGGSGDYSKTNLQVNDVDEADVIKTDGEYIYQVNNKKIVIIKAYPCQEMKIVDNIKLEDEVYPTEIYVDSKNLVIICSSSIKQAINDTENKDDGKRYFIQPYYNYRGTTKAVVYDVSDKTNIKKIREVEVEGDYVSSRKIGRSLYMVTNKSIAYCSDDNKDDINPLFKDSAVSSEYKKVDFSNIRYFPGILESSYLTVMGINLDKQDEAANVYTYLGAGQNVYASKDNLYVAITQNESNPILFEQKASVVKEVYGGVTSSSIKVPSYNLVINTKVFKFSLADGQVTFLNKGEVPGTVLNQFSMDENNNCFRIATTSGNTWMNDEDTSKNNLYVLDEVLNVAGKIEGIAPGEKIYSVRFMGDRAYVVTFKTVDPLFVIDLKDAANPKILGKLKIPGYSDYLHPYDENHIIGFGKDTTEVKGGAYYLGMKIALFDVSDVANPIQKFSEIIGDRGTDSELLRNHKALLFSKEKNLLAFPVTLMKVNDEQNAQNAKEMLQYGSFAYQGAYVYNIDLVNGFKLKGRITHISDEEYAKTGDFWYDSRKNIDRVLYIDDTLYTTSQGMIKANGMIDLKERSKVEIPD